MPKNDPLSNLDQEPALNNNSQKQINDLHDHLVRLQKRMDTQDQILATLDKTLNSPETAIQCLDSFEAKVWETVMMGALSASLGPNRVIQDTPKAMQQMIGRALRLADSGVEAAKAYQREQELQRKDIETTKNNDPLKQLLQ